MDDARHTAREPAAWFDMEVLGVAVEELAVENIA